MKAIAAILLLAVLASPVYAYTPERNLSNFGEVLVSDLGGLVRGEGLLEGWIRIVEVGEPALWLLLLVGGPIALQVLPKKTLHKYITPAPLIPKALVNPADAAKLKKLLKVVDKNAGTLQRILRLFR